MTILCIYCVLSGFVMGVMRAKIVGRHRIAKDDPVVTIYRPLDEYEYWNN